MDKERYREFYNNNVEKTYKDFNDDNQLEIYRESPKKRKTAKSAVLSIISVSLSLVSCTISLMALSVSGNSSDVSVTRENLDEEYIYNTVKKYIDSNILIDETQDKEVENEDLQVENFEETKESDFTKDEEKNKEEETGRNKETQDSYRVGETWNNKYVLVSYNDCGEYISDNQFMQPEEGNKYIYGTFTFDNIGNSDTTVGYWDFDCYADGYACEGTYGADDAGFTQTLSAGRKITGSIYFEVPENASEIEFEYSPNFWTSEKIVFVYQ